MKGAILPDRIAETVTVIPIPRYEERSTVSFVDFVAMKRFGEQVRLKPCLTPVAFSDTIVCFEKNSSQKRFKSETVYVPKVKPNTFSDTLVIFPKRPQKSFVTYLDYHIDECRKWFKTTMEFNARTYTTQKIIGTDLDSEGEHSDSSDDDDVKVNKLNDGPGASQIFLPRWNTDQDMDLPQLVNGDIVINGF